MMHALKSSMLVVAAVMFTVGPTIGCWCSTDSRASSTVETASVAPRSCHGRSDRNSGPSASRTTGHCHASTDSSTCPASDRGEDDNPCSGCPHCSQPKLALAVKKIEHVNVLPLVRLLHWTNEIALTYGSAYPPTKIEIVPQSPWHAHAMSLRALDCLLTI